MQFSSSNRAPDAPSGSRSAAADVGDNVQALREDIASLADSVKRLAAEQRVRSVRLKVAGAFHSPLMEPAVEPLAEAIDASAFDAPRFPVAANVTGNLETDPEVLRDLLKRHVVSPVRWERGSPCSRARSERAPA